MDKIKCAICGGETHAIQMHLRDAHPGVTLADYQVTYPGEPVLSELAKQHIAAKKASLVAEEKEGELTTKMAGATALAAVLPLPGATSQRPLHEVFGLDPASPGALNGRKQGIPVTCVTPGLSDLVPDKDTNYVFDVENLKNSLMALEMNLPLMLWGHTGTGKTTLVEQIAAHTGREVLRVQHSVDTEGSHILGQWTASGGSTKFELGPLPMAMKHGWVYLADEYDFALPSVLSVYQPVLEGKPLVIKEADAANRIIKPHPNFRFVATGNTNGSGDETGLYQGTNIQNSANYDRFNMTLEVKYVKPDVEAEIVSKQGGIDRADAVKLVDVATRIREAYSNNKMSTPISPRTLIAAARIGLRKGNYRAGLALTYSNKLSRVDQGVFDGIAQRVFG